MAVALQHNRKRSFRESLRNRVVSRCAKLKIVNFCLLSSYCPLSPSVFIPRISQSSAFPESPEIPHPPNSQIPRRSSGTPQTASPGFPHAATSFLLFFVFFLLLLFSRILLLRFPFSSLWFLGRLIPQSLNLSISQSSNFLIPPFPQSPRPP